MAREATPPAHHGHDGALVAVAVHAVGAQGGAQVHVGDNVPGDQHEVALHDVFHIDLAQRLARRLARRRHDDLAPASKVVVSYQIIATVLREAIQAIVYLSADNAASMAHKLPKTQALQ